MKQMIYYWDSSVFLGFLGQEKDKIETTEQILEEAEAGNVTIVTSFMSITEVLTVDEKKPRQMSAEDKKKLKGFFRKEYIVWINFDRTVAEASRELLWEHKLKSKDAVHLASAQKLIVSEGVEIDEIHSFDNDFINLSGKLKGVKCPCCKPDPKQKVMLLGDSRKPKKKKD